MEIGGIRLFSGVQKLETTFKSKDFLQQVDQENNEKKPKTVW